MDQVFGVSESAERTPSVEYAHLGQQDLPAARDGARAGRAATDAKLPTAHALCGRALLAARQAQADMERAFHEGARPGQ